MTLMRKLVSLTSLMVLFTSFGFAQGSATGDLHVTVKDQKGNLVTNATVTVRDPAKAFERSTSTNTEGEYRILALPPGKYTVTITAQGFAKVEASDVIITVGRMAELPVTMSVAGAQEKNELTGLVGRTFVSDQGVPSTPALFSPRGTA